MISESSDRRVLAGFHFVDGITGASVYAPLIAKAAAMTIRPNNSGVYAVLNVPGLTNLTTQFAPVSVWPAAQSFEVSVEDPALRYLPRRAQVQAPQPLASIFTPQPVAVYPSPAATVGANWAVVRATVTGTSGAGLPWAVLRVIKADKSIAATGMTDARGEALLAVPGLGLQVSADASGSVTEITIPVTVQAWFAPATLNQARNWVPNPDEIINNLSDPTLKTASMTGVLGARQTLFAVIGISV